VISPLLCYYNALISVMQEEYPTFDIEQALGKKNEVEAVDEAK
jgi:hypothetical protein